MMAPFLMKPLPRLPDQQSDTTINHIHFTQTYPRELHHVKGLFLARQYRQCIPRCMELLSFAREKHDHSRILFLGFYAALSHDCLARLMHDFSSAKLTNLATAESLYLEAIDALSALSLSAKGAAAASLDTRQSEDMEGADLHSKETEDPESHSSFDEIQTPTRSPTAGHDMAPPQTPNAACRSFSRIDLGLQHHQDLVSYLAQDSPDPALPTPQDLSPTIQQTSRLSPESASPCLSASQYTPSPSPNETKANSVGHIPLLVSTQRPTAEAGRATTLDLSITAMQTQLHTALQMLRSQQARTQAARTARDAHRAGNQQAEEGARLPHSRSYWSFSDPQTKNAERGKRIAEGRARGWVRERFQPDRYRRLAEDALAELGL